MQTASSLSEQVLSEEQLEAYHRDGFVVAKVFEKADFDTIKKVITLWIDQRLEALREEGRSLEPFSELPFEQRAGKVLAQASDFFAGFDLNTGLLGPEVFGHLSHPRMLAAVAQILGDEISLNPVMHVRIKPPHGEATRTGYDNVPWHQDAGVYTEDTDGTTILTCWRPICGATVEMGCMELIPGVKGPEPLPHESSPYGTSIFPESLPGKTPVPVPCEIGEVVIMNQYTPHRSTKNLSDRCRWSMDVRYQVKGAPTGRDWQPDVPLTGEGAMSAEEWVESWRQCMERGDMHTQHRVTQREEAR